MSGVAVRVAMAMAHRLGFIDRPGEHKQHSHITPFVGGFGVFAALLGVLGLLGSGGHLPDLSWWALAAGAALMFATGLVDDIHRLGFKIRFVLQTLAALVMVQGGGVLLADLGAIGPSGLVELGWLAVPFTVFATVGVINALNMIDGIDGLSGMLSLISLSLMALLAVSSGHSGLGIVALALGGGVAGFLYFNLRFGTQRRAQVFLGDNGTMLLGFLFAWMLIALSQGPSPAMSPVTALWLISVPLMDTVGVMLRRVWLGKSPFHPDRNHLHHLFLRAGFTVKDTVLAIALIHLGLGGAGILALGVGLPENVLFPAFLGTFAAFFYLTLRPWRFVPFLRGMHNALGLASPETRGVFIGYFPPERAARVRERLSSFLACTSAQSLGIFQVDRHGSSYIYAIMEVSCDDVDIMVDEAQNVMRQLKREYSRHAEVRVRKYVQRNTTNDRRVGARPLLADRRGHDRRREVGKMLSRSSCCRDPGGREATQWVS